MKQTLRWTLECKMVIRNQGHQRKREEAGLGRGKSRRVAQQSLGQHDRKSLREGGLPKLSCIKLKCPVLCPTSSNHQMARQVMTLHDMGLCSWAESEGGCCLWTAGWQVFSSRVSEQHSSVSATGSSLPSLCLHWQMEILIVDPPQGSWEIIILAYNHKDASVCYLP